MMDMCRAGVTLVAGVINGSRRAISGGSAIPQLRESAPLVASIGLDRLWCSLGRVASKDGPASSVSASVISDR